MAKLRLTRFQFIVLLIVASAATAIVWVNRIPNRWMNRIPNRIDPVTYCQLRAGMTKGEVEGLLGPPGMYATSSPCPWIDDLIDEGGYSKKRDIGRPLASLASLEGKYTFERWWADDYAVWVAFDEKDTALGCYLWEACRGSYFTLPQRVWTWLYP